MLEIDDETGVVRARRRVTQLLKAPHADGTARGDAINPAANHRKGEQRRPPQSLLLATLRINAHCESSMKEGIVHYPGAIPQFQVGRR